MGAGGMMRYGRLPKFKWLSAPVLVAAFLVAVEPVIFALDPFLITTATANISSQLSDRIAAPFYGYASDQPNQVSLGTRQVTVLLLDDETIAGIDNEPPMELFEEHEFYLNILKFKPRLLISDRLHAFEQDLLGDIAATIRAGAEANGSHFLIAGAADGGRQATRSIRENLDVTPIIHSAVDKTYPLMLPRPAAEADSARGASGGPVPNLALKAVIDACGPEWAPASGLKGCRELERLKASAPGDAAHIAYGSLGSDAWFAAEEPLKGIRAQMLEAARVRTAERLAREAASSDQTPGGAADVEAFLADDKLVPSIACRTFAPGLSGRFGAIAAEVAGALSPIFQSQGGSRACPYPLTLTRYELADLPNPAYAPFYEAALRDKIVFIGFQSDRPLDRTPELDGRDASIFAHAMMTINLLDHGADHMAPAGDLAPLAAWLFGWDNLNALNVQLDFVAESSVTITLILIFFLIMQRARATGRDMRRGFDAQMVVLWYGLFGIVAFVANVFTFWAFGWPGFNWVGSLVYTEGVRLIAMRLLRSA